MVVLDFGGLSGLVVEIWEQLIYKLVVYSLRCGPKFIGNVIRAQDSSSRKKKCTHYICKILCTVSGGSRIPY